ncbi:putative major facilitator superfamily permease [Actinacidiphila reveromycinica]|uniref:Putative major facilitator superfamily permease n=1 Tax=Actinacidiphila reveromycinica TaxID=659352 RepID=A0A7U3UWU5_9ACTN|nr:MFS transporter [Streptomyces sp. SN-593]BBB00241.1 putative major facilitator superfamily permease [Streptomyces sp. SN-593]
MTTDSEHPSRGGNHPPRTGSDHSSDTTEKEDTGAGYGAVFAVREFRAMFAAHVLSMLGTVFCEVALAVLVFRQTGSALLTALVFALTTLPYALSGLLLSGITDRAPARRILVTCDLLSASCVALMVIPGMPIAALLVLRMGVSIISPLFTGTRGASLSEILTGDLFVLGRSLISMVSQSSQIVGFGVAGAVVAWLTPRQTLYVTVCTFLCSALLLRFGTLPRPARGGRGSALMRESLAASGRLLSHPRIRALLLMWWVPPMFFGVAEGVAVPFAADAGAGSVGYGVFLAAMPAGTVIGQTMAGSLLGPDARDRITLPLAAASLLPLAAFAVHPPLPVAVGLLSVTGLCGAYALGMDRWFVQAVPMEMRGRAMTLLGTGLMTLQGVGMTAAGAVAEAVPPYAVVCGGGLLGTAAVFLVVKSVRRTDPAAEAATPAGEPA